MPSNSIGQPREGWRSPVLDRYVQPEEAQRKSSSVILYVKRFGQHVLPLFFGYMDVRQRDT
jgi:hypothetical protein